MLNKRRNFLKKIGGAASALAFTPLLSATSPESLESFFQQYKNITLDDLVEDEDFWYQIKNAYTVSANIVNLNNGGVSPAPKVVQDAVDRYNKLSNEAPSYYMWRTLDKGREGLRTKLADLAGVLIDEIAINRNSSEALETVIFGLRLQKGDEVVLTKQDYPNMINAWKQRAVREGIVLKFISLNLPIENKEEIVQLFKKEFTSKTKVVHITHMINWSGQILPVKEIADEAKKNNIEVLVDAAHTFAQLDYKIPDLNCDYFGTSLHKWLCAPIGSGLLWVRKEKIKNLYPLLAANDPESEDIRKFEALGTRSFAIEQAIGQAIDFHHWIGAERKQKRLHYLKNYWVERVSGIPNVKINTSLKAEFGCAICLFSILDKNPIEVSRILLQKYKIHTVGIEWENISGVRVTPNVYTVKKDLDRLVTAIKEISAT